MFQQELKKKMLEQAFINESSSLRAFFFFKTVCAEASERLAQHCDGILISAVFWWNRKENKVETKLLSDAGRAEGGSRVFKGGLGSRAEEREEGPGGRGFEERTRHEIEGGEGERLRNGNLCTAALASLWNTSLNLQSV